MREDIERWQRKYAAGNPNPGFDPDPVLLAHGELLPSAGIALDVACGVGGNALFLAERGLEVVAIDASLTGLRYCREALRARPLPVHLVAADLDRMRLPPAYFDVVVVVKYLNRELLPALTDALRPGGLLFYRTFNVNHLNARPGFKREYLLEPGELRERLEAFELIDTNDETTLTDNLSYWVGYKPASRR